MTNDLPKRDRRRFLRDSALATMGFAGVMEQRARTAPIAQQERSIRTAVGSKSLSRQFAEWVVRLRYEDLPADVVDRAKGLTLQNLSSALLGAQLPAGQQAITFITQEEAGVTGGATIMVAGTKATKGGASWDGDYPGCARCRGKSARLGT
jgi:hypothetical protein